MEAEEANRPPYISAVSINGRYFVDQYGNPIRVQGDSPWSLMTRLSPAEAKAWFRNRSGHGYTAAIVSLIGTSGNGGPSNDGSTRDGLVPFVDADILSWNEPYWQRVRDYAWEAADNGISLMLYPIDGWVLGNSIVPKSTNQCRDYGARVAAHLKDLPNILWMSGGDYVRKNAAASGSLSDDDCLVAMKEGIRSTGDKRPFSMQFVYPQELSTEDPFWAPRVDWNFVYSYSPTYRDTLRAYDHRPTMPALLGESNYEGEDNGGKPTTNETLRRQILWAMTSGAAGDFAGSRDWKFDEGWETRLDTDAVAQIAGVRRIVAKMPWWEMAPDRALVTAGQGTPLPDDREADMLDSDYATAARTEDGRFAAVYIPTARTVTIDRAKLSADVQALWVDPSTGASRPAGSGTAFTTPGPNAAGDGDWLLILSSTPF
ncbi:MAG: DUF4038 domain-containing protein [Austwickia sp.]|nr:MAG: DUF4038 domain-containing protein [Austwickia sp.]